MPQVSFDFYTNNNIPQDPAGAKPCYLFFDTETTGLPRDYNAPASQLDNWPRLVQIAWMSFDESGKSLGEGMYIVKPDGFEIPTTASDIHGITTAKALAKGLPLTEVLITFIKELKQTQHLVAHNMSYDIKIIEAEFIRQELEHDLEAKALICTKELSTEFCAIPSSRGFKWPRLSELHIKLFGTDFEDAHDAMVDVRATAKCFWELKHRGVI